MSKHKPDTVEVVFLLLAIAAVIVAAGLVVAMMIAVLR